MWIRAWWCWSSVALRSRVGTAAATVCRDAKRTNHDGKHLFEDVWKLMYEELSTTTMDDG